MTLGYWAMPCWNGLSVDQQRRLMEWGNLPFGYVEAGWCQRGAELEVTTMWDRKPGPRFYCLPCAAQYLRELDVSVRGGEWDNVGGSTHMTSPTITDVVPADESDSDGRGVPRDGVDT